MDGVRVLITGASGFVGGRLVRQIAEDRPDWSVIPVSGPHAPPGEIGLDLGDADAVERLLRQQRPTVIVHLAAVSAVGEASRDPRRAWAINLMGTLNLTQALLKETPQAHLLYVSSGEVYGPSLDPEVAFDELGPPRPANPYAASKAAAEVLVGEVARSGLKVTIARPFNHTGAGQSDRFAIPAFASQIAAIEAGRGEPVIKVGNLDDRRDFTDVADIASGYIRIVERGADLDSGDVFNLCSGRSHRIGDLLSALLARSTAPIRIEVDPLRLRGPAPLSILGNPEKAARILHWRATRPIDVMLANVLDYWRSRA